MNPNPNFPAGQRQIRLEMPNNLNATYSNSVIISHTTTEVVFDFVQIMPNDPRARVQSRIVMTPVSAKLFMRALQENLQRFEEKNGEIVVPPQPPSLAEHLFSSVKPNENEAGDPINQDEGNDHDPVG
jgi:Protein of unknown function (DUF3467)